MSKLLLIPITPHAHTEIAPIVHVLAAFPWREQPATRQDRLDEAGLLLDPVVLYWSDMLMRWVVAECAFGGDADFSSLGRSRLASFGVENYGETLASRRRDALCWPVVTDLVVCLCALGAIEVHWIGGCGLYCL